MKNEIKYLRIDLKGQKVLFFLMLGSIFTIYLIPMGVMLLGVWQISSAIFFGWRLKDWKRGGFLIFYLAYLTLMAVVGIYFGDILSINLALLLGLYLVGPTIGGIWYWRHTKHALEEFKRGDGGDSFDRDDILDAP